jgi:hypothetical protein
MGEGSLSKAAPCPYTKSTAVAVLRDWARPGRTRFQMSRMVLGLTP